MERGTKDGGKTTTILYKKSLSTLRGRNSRPSSIRTHNFPKSGTHHLKLRTSGDHLYYCDGTKVKRDLSIETDVCRRRRNVINRASKYSDSIKSTFADGDSCCCLEPDAKAVKFHNVDIVSLIVDNFRGLLNKWIREYLLDSSDNLQRIEAIRESLLQKFDKKLCRASKSTCKSSLDSRRKRVGRQYLTKDSIPNCETCSNYTVPLQNKRCGLISSLSLPRNINKQINAFSSKNIWVPLNKQSDIADSTLILIAMSSRSFTKRCATYNEPKPYIERKRSFVNLQGKKTLYRSVTSEGPIFLRPSTAKVETISLVRNIYGDSDVQMQPETKNDKDTMTDEHGYECRSCSRSNSSRKYLRKLKSSGLCLNNIKSRHFTYLYRKASKRNSRSNEFINHFQTILNYFEQYEGQKNVILDVHVNVSPVENPVSYQEHLNKTCKHQFTISPISKANCGCLDTLMESRESESSSKDSKSSENHPEIISLLDGSESKAKYIVENENNSEVVEIVEPQQINNNPESSASNTNAESFISDNKINICYQIDSLKNVIKGLTLTAEKLISDHMREKTNTSCRSTQVDVYHCHAAVDTLIKSFPNTSTPMNSNNQSSQSYAMWYSQNPVIFDTVPEMTKQLMNVEMANYKTPTGCSDLKAIPHSSSVCNKNNDSFKDLKPEDQEDNFSKSSSNQSKGIQFSCNIAGINPGLKLQTQSKTTNPFPILVKKPSFCYIESESLLKVTDMTSKPEIPIPKAVKEVGLSCSFASPPSHFEIIEENVARNITPYTRSSIKLYSCGDGFSKREIYVSPEREPRYSQRIQKTSTAQCQSEELMQQFHINQERSELLDQYDQSDQLKSSKNSRCLKFFKISLFCLILCVLVVAVTLVSVYTDIKQIWQRTVNSIWTTEAISAKNTSDLHLLLSEFGF
ncbi:uncharacterized protein LOC133530836 [Cydia pomonella]|uniref:uncharacterized protein LOC133530836 n=1 Tax=Cydia pomonella TaxID=82600 RepID=UPI002ADDD2BE|nr:uncharacterized protein LOC133530836 [Cydia pomonella]